jgi:DNA-binding SARP family transcriptional activator/predicted ATPase/Tfp pilus assembly protein PilF
MRKEQALLAYLAVESDRPHRRDALAELFWPERPEGVARAGLRQALSDVRRAIGREYLQTTRLTAQFNTATDYWLDLELYRAQLAAARSHPHDDPEACPLCMGRLQQAVALYRGPFLAGLELDDSRAFQEWVTLHRERLFRQQGEALRRLAVYRLALGELERARRYARRWVEMDPWSERAHRQWMEVLALSGQRRGAMEQFETCRRILADELGVEPRPETVALYEQIRDGTIWTPAALPPPSLQNLPAQLTPFVGREPELGRVARLLSRPECRLLTIVGPGGVGKTRLALRAAEQIYGADTFAEGVWFVPLEDVASPDLVPVTVAEALGLDPRPKQTPEQQLLDHLRPRTMLLVLDNLEHLMHPGAQSATRGTDRGGEEAGQDPVECIDLILAILREAPGVKIVVTSRERLNCQAEFLLDLEGLPYPTQALAGSDDRSGLDYTAVQLFLERAGRVRPGIAATAGTAPSIVRICQLVEGLPLGIELAAANLGLPTGRGQGSRTCAEVAQAIQGGLDALSSSLHDLSARQRTIRVVFEDSWRLLTEGERQTYRRLSVFRGGFGPAAARAVVGEGGEACQGEDSDAQGSRGALPLQGLVDRSLVRQDGAGRDSLHPLLRQYAAEKLAAHPTEEATTRRRHARFYLTFLQEREEAFAGAQAQEGLDEVQAEMANVRAAWAWAVAQQEIEGLSAAAPTLADYYNRRGLFREGEATFGNTAEHLFEGSSIPESPVAKHLLARLRLEQARFLFMLGRYAPIHEHTRTAITLAAACDDPIVQARAELIRGYVHHKLGELLLAQSCYERALSLARTGNPDGGLPVLKSRLEVQANSLNGLAMVARRQGRYGEAERYLEQSLRAAREAHDLAGQCRALNGLGMVVSRRGDLSQALDHYQGALDAARSCGDRALEGALLNNLGNVHLHLGLYAEAGTHYEQALEIQREIGARAKAISASFNLGLVHHYRGDQETARSRFQQALAIAGEMGHRRAQAFAWLGMGHALLGLQALSQAREAYQRAVTLRLELDQAHLTAEPQAGLARVCLAQGDLGQAQSHVEALLDHLASGETFADAVSPFQVCLTCYRVLGADQDPRAEELLKTAHGLLQEQAAKITDEQLRHSFLENVATHRELVQAFEQTC